MAPIPATWWLANFRQCLRDDSTALPPLLNRPQAANG